MASQELTRLAYGKSLTLTHKPSGKVRYTVTDNYSQEITHPSGVTTILNEILAKDLIGWALNMFETAILNKLNSLLDDEPLSTEDVAEAKLASEHKRNDGAATGTRTHQLIEEFLAGEMEKLNVTGE